MARAEHLAAVSEMRLRMRALLEARASEESAVDRRSLLARKLAVDGALAPALLLLELAAAGSQEPFAALRVDYQGGSIALQSVDAATADRLAAHAAAWDSALGGGVAFEYRSWRHGAGEDDFPALIHWRGIARADALSLQAHWFEPFLGQRRLDFPLNPEGLRVDFTVNDASVRSPFPSLVTASRSFPHEAPRFRNPADLYDLFDGLRIASLVLREPAPVIATADAPGDGVIGPGVARTGGSSTVPGAVLIRLPTADAPSDDGSPREVRTVEWSMDGHGVRSVDIWQPVLPIRFEAGHVLVGEATVHGERVGGESRRPVANLPWFPGGLHARLAFRSPSPELDPEWTTSEGGASISLLDRITLGSRGQPLFTAEFGTFRRNAGSERGPISVERWSEIESAVLESISRRDRLLAAAGVSPDRLMQESHAPSEILGAVDPLVARWRLRVNLLAAALAGDAARHDEAIALMQRRLEQDGVHARWAVMNAQAWFEELAGPLGRPTDAVALAAPAWLALSQTLEPADQLAEVARLALSGRWGLALVLARAVSRDAQPTGAGDWLAHFVKTVEPWVRSPDAGPDRPGSHQIWNPPIDAAVGSLLDPEVAP